MERKVKFRKKRIIGGIIFSIVGVGFSITFLFYSETFLRSPSEMPEFMQLLGCITLLYFSALLFSFFTLINREYALIISDDYLIDNSRYESFGKIYWEEISKVRRKGKTNLELVLKEPSVKRKGLSYLKKYLLFMHNWNYKSGFLISSALLDCNINELNSMVNLAYRRWQRNNKT